MSAAKGWTVEGMPVTFVSNGLDIILVFGYSAPRRWREELYGIVARVSLAVRLGRIGRHSVSVAVAERRCRFGCDWRAESLAPLRTGRIADGRQAFFPRSGKKAIRWWLCENPAGLRWGSGCRKILKESELTDVHSSANKFFLLCACRSEWVASVIRPASERGDIALHDLFSDSTFAYRFGRELPADNCNQPLSYRLAVWFRTVSVTGTCLGSRSRPGAALASWLGLSVLRTESTNRGRLFFRRCDEHCRQLVGRHPGRIHVVGGRGSVEMIDRDVRDTNTAAGSGWQFEAVKP